MRGKRVSRPTKASILRSVNGAWVPTAEEMGTSSSVKFVTVKRRKERPASRKKKPSAKATQADAYPEVLTRRQFSEMVARLCTPTFASLSRQTSKYGSKYQEVADHGWEVPSLFCDNKNNNNSSSSATEEAAEENFEQFEFPEKVVVDVVKSNRRKKWTTTDDKDKDEAEGDDDDGVARAKLPLEVIFWKKRRKKAATTGNSVQSLRTILE